MIVFSNNLTELTLKIPVAGVSIATQKHKVRFVSILLSLAATYVIGDMYSANLTSMLARPARGLYQLKAFVQIFFSFFVRQMWGALVGFSIM